MPLPAPLPVPTPGSLRALIDVTLSNFENRSIRPTNGEMDGLSSIIERFLCREISFDTLSHDASQIVTDIHPLSMLQAIVTMSPDPIPFSDDEVGRHGTRRCGRYWSSYEDQRLLAGILRYGMDNWTLIASFVGNGRTRSKCSQRWYRGLNPSVVKGQWSKDEEDRLIQLVRASRDQSWTKIALQLGNRSDVQCRYRYHQLVKERMIPEQTLVPLMMMPVTVAPFPFRVPYTPPMPQPPPQTNMRGSPILISPVPFPMQSVPSPFPPPLVGMDQGHQAEPPRPIGQETVAHSLTAPVINGKRYSVY
jgi:hypothetical protein